MLRPDRPGRRSPRRFPDRCFDVGIAEQHAVTSAAGMAMGGLHPVVAVYSTFLNRAFDQLLMDVALHQLPVTSCSTGPGVTGDDGPSHHGMWDLSILRRGPGHAGRRAAGRRHPARGVARGASTSTTARRALRFPKGAVDRRRAGASSGSARSTCSPSRRPTHDADVLLVAVGALAELGV